MTPKLTAPELMPVLSRGKHRNARRGACFMEMASFLAGERWSDHPACTHPLLADLSRLVNDVLTDQMRSQLIPMIPSVIGLTSDDVHVDAAVALRSAYVALPIVAVPQQHVLATAVLAAERFIAGLDGRDPDSPDSLSPQSREVLDQVPEAEEWARSFSSGERVSPKTFRGQIAPHIVSIAVESIALAAAPEVEQLLIDLLRDAIADCEAMVTADAPSQHAPSQHAPSQHAPSQHAPSQRRAAAQLV
jgi:hypothetical protein